jgi:hypothetical protein
MALLTVRAPEDSGEWPAERLALITTVHVMISGEPYPITEAKVKGGSALLTIDTGDDGPDLPAGASTDAGTVI